MKFIFREDFYMKNKNNYYWMYSKHAIESALLNPKRNILEILIEDKLSETREYDLIVSNNINKLNRLLKNLKIKKKE